MTHTARLLLTHAYIVFHGGNLYLLLKVINVNLDQYQTYFSYPAEPLLPHNILHRGEGGGGGGGVTDFSYIFNLFLSWGLSAESNINYLLHCLYTLLLKVLNIYVFEMNLLMLTKT